MKKNTKLLVWIVSAIIVAAIIVVAMITSSAKNETLATVDGHKITKEDLYDALVESLRSSYIRHTYFRQNY